MARFTIVREERTRDHAGIYDWSIVDSATIDTGETRYTVVMSAQEQYAQWRGLNPDRRIVVHEWDR